MGCGCNELQRLSARDGAENKWERKSGLMWVFSLKTVETVRRYGSARSQW